MPARQYRVAYHHLTHMHLLHVCEIKIATTALPCRHASVCVYLSLMRVHRVVFHFKHSWFYKKIVQWPPLIKSFLFYWKSFNHSQVWTNLTVILADTQSIAINARATFDRNLQQQGTIIARTLTSPWHSTKSSTNSSIWSTNQWAVTLARRLRKVRRLSPAPVTLGLD